MHVADPRQTPAGIYLYTLHPTRLAMLTEGPTPDEMALAGQHWAYSQELLGRGVIFFAGRTLAKDSDSFAMVAIRASSPEAARAIMDADPAVVGGVFAARLFPFQPMMMGDWPSEAAAAASPMPASASA